MLNRGRIVFRAAAFVAVLLFSPAAIAAFHLFRIEQVYSNASGSIQFIVMLESSDSNNEHQWGGHTLQAFVGNAYTSTFVFNKSLPSNITRSKRVLIATQGFAALGILTPDYIIPNNFLPTGSGGVDFANVDVVSWSSLPTDGANAIDRNGAVIPNVATNFAGQSASVDPAAAGTPPAPEVNYQGLWWRSPPGSEAGWGVNFAHQGNTIFATWFTYAEDGKPLWLAAAATRTGLGVYTGDLFTTTGPAFNAVPFNSGSVVETTVGTVTITFTDSTHGTFAYTVNTTAPLKAAVTQSKSIVRQEFATPVPTCAAAGTADPALATNYQDLWWNSPAGSEAGWGVNLTHQGDTIFATWFTYDAAGKPLWLAVSAAKTAAGVYSGDLFTTTGPALSAVPFDPATVVETTVGTATFTFSNGNNAVFDYTVNGTTQSKPITRQVFGTVGTLCSTG